VCCHPFGARQMTVKDLPRAGRLLGRIDVENDPPHFGPIGVFAIGVEKPQIGNDMFFVIARQRIGCRGGIGDF